MSSTQISGRQIKDGSLDSADLSDSGIVAGTYNGIAFDAKGRATSAVSWYLNSVKGTDIASAATIAIPTDGQRFDLTGTTGITSITTTGWATGSRFILRATGVVSFTHNASTLDLRSGATFSSRAGDWIEFEVIGANAVREVERRARFTPPRNSVSGSNSWSNGVEYELLCSAASAATTQTLPTTSNAFFGQRFIIRKTDSTIHPIIIAASGGQLIEGMSSIRLATQYSYAVLTSDGLGWSIVAQGTPGVVPLTDATTIATDCSNLPKIGGAVGVTLGGNRTLGAPTNPTDGQLVTWRIRQDATGSRTLALNAIFAFGTTLTSITLSTTANKTDYLTARYDSVNAKWHITDFAAGF